MHEWFTKSCLANRVVYQDILSYLLLERLVRSVKMLFLSLLAHARLWLIACRNSGCFVWRCNQHSVASVRRGWGFMVCMSGSNRGSCPYNAQKGLMRVDSCTEVLYAWTTKGRTWSHDWCNGPTYVEVTCLIVRFRRSVSPLDCGWYNDVKTCVMPKLWLSMRITSLWNCDPWSNKSWRGQPWGKITRWSSACAIEFVVASDMESAPH